MMMQIHDATLDDIPQLIQIIRVTHDEAVTEPRLAKIINKHDKKACHCLLVAKSDKELAGFISGFMTLHTNGNCRWELDLLGVLPRFQNQGVGRKLIQEFLTRGKHIANVKECRALVAVDNAPMQRIMKLSQFEREESAYTLLIKNIFEPIDSSNSNCRLIPVQTCTYDGIWLEGEIEDECIKSACNLGASLGYELAGAVVMNQRKPIIGLLQDYDFEIAGQFHWWQHSYA